MQVREIMNSNVEVIHHTKSLLDAARMMRDGDYGSLPVEENDKMIGMITDRDIVIRGVAENKDMEKTTVKECMTPGIDYCFDEDTVEDIAQRMSEDQHRRIPVVNRDKKLVGIVTLRDISLKAHNRDVTQKVMTGVTAH